MKSHNKEKQFGQTLYVVCNLLDHIDLIALVQEAYSHGIEKRQVIMWYTKPWSWVQKKKKDLDLLDTGIIKVIQSDTTVIVRCVKE